MGSSASPILYETTTGLKSKFQSTCKQRERWKGSLEQRHYSNHFISAIIFPMRKFGPLPVDSGWKFGRNRNYKIHDIKYVHKHHMSSVMENLIRLNMRRLSAKQPLRSSSLDFFHSRLPEIWVWEVQGWEHNTSRYHMTTLLQHALELLGKQNDIFY